MLVTAAPPPLPFQLRGHHFGDLEVLCPSYAPELGCPPSTNEQDLGLAGLGEGVDPISNIAGAIGGIANIFVAQEQTKQASKLAKIEAAKVKAQNVEAARIYAQQQADEMVRPYREARYIQLAALGGIALAAGVVGVMFLRAATRE